MKKTMWLVIAFFTAGAWANGEQPWPSQDGVVTVVWQEPDDYRDVKTGSGIQSRYQNHVFATLGQHLQRKIEPLLSEGQKATITVTDLDLAGDVRPTFGATPNDIRVVKGVYPPRMTFSYQVINGNNEVKASGKEDLSDLGFDNRSGMPYRNESLRYEMIMLDDWISRTLKPQL